MHEVEEKAGRLLEFCSAQLGRTGHRPLVVGLQAPQGAGKTTLVTRLMERLPQIGLRGVAVSIDDFYLTRKEQLRLASAHPGNPYLEHRGYPGTHDVALGEATLLALRGLGQGSDGRVVSVPVYDKSQHGGRGDRAPEGQWRQVAGPLDLVIVEGWMLGFTPVPEASLADPFLTDPNRALASYEAWYRLIDAMVILRATEPTFVLRWRVEAEEAMKARGLPGLSREAIEDYVRRFLPAYALYAGRADRWPAERTLVLALDERRRISRLSSADVPLDSVSAVSPALSPKAAFLQSLLRCEAQPDFIPRFYRHFIGSSAEVAFKFRFTDFERQQHMLLRSLQLCAQATAGDPDGLAELSARAETHSRSHLDIKPELYTLWLDAAIETVRECDPAWSPEVSAAWRQVVGFAILHMAHGYDPSGPPKHPTLKP
jgi:pantothenate kinase-related protein Tda10/hemoglobin-like flavoprotein